MCYINTSKRRTSIVFYACFFLFNNLGISQPLNLVQNGSFEIIDTCNLNPGGIYHAYHWFDPTNSTSDLFNSCCTNIYFSVPFQFAGNFQIPKSGNGYSGINSFQVGSIYREYITNKLLTRLKKNKYYCFNSFLVLYDNSSFACNSLGVYFSVTMPLGNSPNELNVIPQIINTNNLSDTGFWLPLAGCYRAIGDEEFVTIGNFKNNQNSYSDTIRINNQNIGTYYCIDDVSLYEVRGLNNTEDTTICSATGFTKILRVDTAYHNILWSTGDTTPQITVNTGGKYWVTSTSPCCGVVTDTINIKLINPNNLNFSLGNDTVVCGAFTKTLKTNIAANKYLWSTNDTTNQINVNQAGIYWLTCQTECGVFSDTITITEATIPNNIIIQNDTTIYVGDTIVLNALSGLQQYEWGTTTGFITNSQLQGASYTNVIAAQAAISLSAFTNDGCIIEDTLIVITKAKPTEQLPIVYPTILFASKEKLVFKNLPQGASISIYNNLGQIIFESNNYNNEFPTLSLFGAAGGGLSDGIYYYRLVFENETVVKKFVVLK